MPSAVERPSVPWPAAPPPVNDLAFPPMTTKPSLLLVLVFAASVLTALAHEKAVGGPNGGRLLTKLEPHAELLVREDRRIQIVFLDGQDKPVPAAGQTVTVTTGSRLSPTTLTFERSGDVLVSTRPLPEGNNLPAVVQIRVSPESSPVVERFNLNLATCPDCSRHEYACICDH